MGSLTIQAPSIEETPRRFRLVASEAWWSAASLVPDEPPTRVLEPFALELEAYRIGGRLLFRGRLVGAVELVCGRCTEAYRFELQEPVELLLEPIPPAQSERQDPPEGGIELDPEDLSLGHYAGDELDFAPVLVEGLLTAWPMQPRCREGCRGLCPSCGENLNAGPCECDTGRGNRPFQDLGDLLSGRGGGGSGKAAKGGK